MKAMKTKNCFEQAIVTGLGFKVRIASVRIFGLVMAGNLNDL